MPDDILVTSHVGRDFLQNAAYFSSAQKVVWEYVSNSIDNVEPGSIPEIAVEVRQDSLIVSDNAAGMDRSDLARFFTMHAENAQRLRGRTVRGKFGTGKTAAFGIAKELDIVSVKGGIRNSVILRIEDIQSANAGDPFPVESVERDIETDEENGTTVTVRRFHHPGTADIQKVVRYIEKQLGRMRSRAIVFINEHRCEYQEPPSVQDWTFITKGEIAERLGQTTMTIKASPTPIDRDENGIDIMSNGIWHETTLADVSGEQANRIFGHVDVPALDDDSRYDVPAFDNTRNGTLNRSNPAVIALLYWIQECVRQVQRELAAATRKERKSEEAKRLRQHAEKIASLLNTDFSDILDELDELRQITGRKRRGAMQSDAGDTVLPGEGTEPAKLVETAQPHGNGKRGHSPPGDGETERPGPGLKPGNGQGQRGSLEQNGSRRRSRGVFNIEFAHQTPDERRSKYDRETRTI
ncbi:MAG: ATP-binding protein, partial [Spirochaetota bacterium]